MRLLRTVATLVALAAASAGALASQGASVHGKRSRLAPAKGVSVPPGFRAEIFARGLHRPTALAYGPGGRLYAAQESGEVVAVAAGARPRTVAAGFRTPLGLAWRARTLFVSAQGALYGLRVVDGRARERWTVVRGLPYELHQQNNVVVGRDGRLYIGSGSTCNACAEADRRSAAILSVRPDGGDLRVVASGLRNPFGLAVHPGSGRLFASVNGRDDLGSARAPEPAEMVVRVRRGAWYGWPQCWPSMKLRKMVGRCRGVTPPLAYLEPHSSADGIVFYDDDAFPPRFRGDLFVAQWGQYNERRFGRRVVRVELPVSRRQRARVSTFATGFEHPLAVAVDPLGALLVADWGRGVIYRIQAAGRR